jgi:hypothetical protein
MHQSVVEYDVAPAAMTAVPSALPGRAAPLVLQSAAGRTADSGGPIPSAGPTAVTGGARAYITAACIAASLIAAWFGLIVI